MSVVLWRGISPAAARRLNSEIGGDLGAHPRRELLGAGGSHVVASTVGGELRIAIDHRQQRAIEIHPRNVCDDSR